mgnify:CR=1 FL=1
MGNIATTGYATEAVSVTPEAHNAGSLTVDLNGAALYVGGAGDLKITMADDTAEVAFKSIPAGTFLPIAVKHVRNFASSGNATEIVALY